MKKFFAIILSVCILFCQLAVSAESGLDFYSELNYVKRDSLILPARPMQNPKLRMETGGLSALSDEQKISLYNKIYSAVSDRDNAFYDVEVGLVSPIIDLTEYNFTMDDIAYIFQDVVNYYPELFDIDITGYFSDGTFLAFAYLMDKNSYYKKLAQYDAVINYIIGGMQPNWSDLEKVLYVHNYFVTHSVYDESLAIHDAYNLLVNGTGVCQSYTLAFTAIMHKLGIACTSVLDASDHHTWNLVEINGNYYHLDLTHNDPVGNSEGEVDYSHFLLSSESMKNCYSLGYQENEAGEEVLVKVYNHQEWYTIRPELTCDDRSYREGQGTDNVICTDKTYETGYVWNKSDTGLAFANGEWYYIDAKNADYGIAALYKTDSNFKTEKEVSQTDALLLILNNENGEETYKYFGGMTVSGTDIYYSAFDYYKEESCIRCYDTINQTYREDIVNPTDGTYIASLRYDNFDIKIDATSSSYRKICVFECPKKYLGAYFTAYLPIYMKGDTDGDGAINTTDLVNARKLLLGEAYDFNWARLDFGGNLGIDLTDFVKLKKLMAS